MDADAIKKQTGLTRYVGAGSESEPRFPVRSLSDEELEEELGRVHAQGGAANPNWRKALEAEFDRRLGLDGKRGRSE